MKQILALLTSFAILLSCNNSGCGCDDADRFYTPQTAQYWYIITKPTNPLTYFIVSSATEISYASQVGPDDWYMTNDWPRELNAEGVTNLGVAYVDLDSLPANLQNLLK